MELWIRSQNKKILIKTDYIGFEEWNNEYRIYISAEIFGKYKSKERALEVLDEIQRQLIGKKGLITTQDKKGIEFIPFTDTVVVYEMPKE